MKRYNYDIALSFAGEEREYVRSVAEALLKLGIKVFFDNFEIDELWGKFLPEYLREIYRHKARYCIIFISKNYVRKIMTKVERYAALERAIREDKEYILPARFDDTPVPGLSEDIAFIDLRKVKLFEFVRIIKHKIGIKIPRIPIINNDMPYKVLFNILKDRDWHFDQDGNFNVQYGYIEPKNYAAQDFLIDKIYQKLAILLLAGFIETYFIDYECGAVIGEAKLTKTGMIAKHNIFRNIK